MIGRLGAALFVLPAVTLAAQDTTRAVPPRDTTVAPPVARVDLPELPLEGPPGPLPAGSRWIFTRDSLVWSAAYSVADLLADIPGVFAARTGFEQGATALGVGGRGTDGVEVYWDGIPWQPVGPDSLGPDLSAISLFPLRRVEVHQLPGLLRVFLVSERRNAVGSRSVLRIVSGAQRAGGYAALFQQGWANGLRLSVAADAFGTERPAGQEGGDSHFDTWARLDWSPLPTLAASWQLRRAAIDRDPSAAPPVLADGRRGTRTDAILSLRASTRPAGAGWSAGATLRSSGFADSIFGERVMREALLEGGHRGARDELHLRAGIGDGAVRRRLELDGGLVPFAPFVVHGGARWTRDAFARDSWRWWGSAGITIGPFTLTGDAVHHRAVAQPLVATDTVQRATDLGVRLAFAGRRIAGRIGVERRGPWAPSPVSVLDELPLGTTVETDWAVVWLRLGPVRAFSLTGWYADARGADTPDLQPPTHSRFELAYRNNFRRTFRSGVFDLEIHFALEAWSAGAAGRQPGGSAIALPGATFQEWFVQFEIAGFHAFYLLRNARNSEAGYLPGFPQPRNAQTFGVKWEFSS